MAHINSTIVLNADRPSNATYPVRFHPACSNEAWVRILELDNRLTRAENVARRAAAMRVSNEGEEV